MNEFWTSILWDPQLEAYWEKKENLELTQEEGWVYIDRLSDFAVDALQKTLNTATLPDEILYWNIAQAVIPDFLREVSNMIYEIQVATWKKEDLEMGINAGFQQAPFNEEKMQSIINMMVNNSMKNAGAVDDEADNQMRKEKHNGKERLLHNRGQDSCIFVENKRVMGKHRKETA